jgi:diguanylate cyclase (GGDEF)-like protein
VHHVVRSEHDPAMPDSQDPSQSSDPIGSGLEQPQPPAANAGNGGRSAPQPATPDGDAGEAARSGESWSGRVPWLRLALALLVVAAGTIASFLGAQAVVHHDAQSARRAFSRGAAGTAAAAKLAVAHQEGLTTAAGTYLSRNPESSTSEFDSWTRWARALRNHPELESLGVVALVRGNELAAFGDRLAGRKPKRPASAKAVPAAPGYSCLTIGQVGRSPAAQLASTSDLCASDRGLLASRDSATTRYVSVSVDGTPALEVMTPAYRGSTTPRTLIGRRAAFAGWVREVIEPQVMLAAALRGLPTGSARLRHRGGGPDAVFTAGAQPAQPQTSAAPLQGGWSLRTFAPPVSESLAADGDALALLIVGILASLLAGAHVVRRARRPEPPPAVAEVVEQRPPEDLHDALTGLPNRGLTMDRAERMLARAGRNSSIMVGALFIDIDWFKDFNDKLGEEAGDQLLKIVAERLETVVRTHDTVGRYSGDEFVVIVESPVRGMRLDSLARRIIESLHKPVDVEGFGPSFCLTASIGVAFGRYATADDLLRDAHMALFAAKAAGKDRYTLFNANMRSIIEGRGVLEVDLNTALQEGQFSLLYQPVYELSTRRVVALEALLRWVHPTRGEVDPADFVPLAEDSGLIVPIGRWVLEEACTRAAALNVAGHRVAIAVKVSAKQLTRDGFATDVLRALQQSGLEPSLLALEIAETTVMEDKAEAASRMEALKALGVRIAVDDFGSGYAYRADLQRMPIDFLKVDRGSLAASEDEDYRSWLLEAILVFGRDLSLTVIAKGVESQEQAAALQAMGCTMAQGFFLSEPVPAEGIDGLFSVVPADVAVAPSAAQPSESQ